MSIFSRPYSSEADYVRMRVLLTDIYAVAGPPVYCTVGDLDWWRWTDDRTDAVALVRLWLDEGDNVIGIAWPGDEQVDLNRYGTDGRNCIRSQSWRLRYR